MMEPLLQNHFKVPGDEKRILLHSCCAPCSCAILETMKAAGLEVTVYFYNPNIHPREEYEKRKAEIVRYAAKQGITLIDGDYHAEQWFEMTRGHEQDPERGERCSLCFLMRFVKTAEYAFANQFPVFTSSLVMSQWKDFDQVTAAGREAALWYPGIRFWDYVWRGEGRVERMNQIIRDENFLPAEILRVSAFFTGFIGA